MLVGFTAFGQTIYGDFSAVMQPTADVFFDHLNTLPSPPTRYRPEIPAWLEAVCLKLLAKAPADRYETPDALNAELQRPRTP